MSQRSESIWTSGEGATLPTGISGAFWCDQTHSILEPVPARDGSGQLCWLDELLNGGIHLPRRQGGSRALSILVTGSPGTGKSTFASELCYRWAKRWPDFTAEYITTEAHRPWLIDNLRQLFGAGIDDAFGPDGRVRVTEVSGQELADANTKQQSGADRRSLTWILNMAGIWTDEADPASRTRVGGSAHLIVIDSLNIIPEEQAIREVFLSQVSKLLDHGPKIVLFILDSHARGPAQVAKFWEYYCDLIIRLDRTYPPSPSGGYMLRTIEIVKARYQQHAWGPHQLKIYPHDASLSVNHSALPEQVDAERERLMRAHPFRTEGGIYIYPSVHYMLSQYKRIHPASVTWDEPPIAGLRDMLKGDEGGGFPRERCIAFVGTRGCHKSHLGFMHLLSRILDHNECGIVVSLRDDVGISKSAMASIIKGWAQSSAHAIARHNVDEIKRDLFRSQVLMDSLEIMYFPPGNITPEEFLHRIRLSVLRLKHTAVQCYGDGLT